MKIIQVHNYYQQAGGEDSVVEAERTLLEEEGNIVFPIINGMTILRVRVVG